jgi:hypothetical protein
MSAELDDNVAPTLIQDVKRIMVHVRIGPLDLYTSAVQDVEDGSLGSTLDD